MSGIVALFLIVQFGGLLVAFLVTYTSSATTIYQTLANQQAADFSYVIDFMLVMIIVLLLMNKHKNSEKWEHRFIRSFEGLVLIATSSFAFLFAFTVLLPRSVEYAYLALAIVGAVAVVTLREKERATKNAATIISSIGVGLVLGFYFTFEYTIIILGIVAVYDYLSVFVTKSMIALAKMLSREDSAFLIEEEDIVAMSQESLGPESTTKYLKELSENKEDEDPLFKKLLEKGKIPEISSIQLGEGDLGLPLMIAVSAFFAFNNFFMPVFIVVGSGVGIMATLFLLKRYNRPLPAIPPLFAFIAAFSGIAFLITGKESQLISIALILMGISVFGFGMMFELSRGTRKGEED